MKQVSDIRKNYEKLISEIARKNNKDSSLYDKAKLYLKEIYPDWDDVKLEMHVLWDVREYFHKNSKKNF